MRSRLVSNLIPYLLLSFNVDVSTVTAFQVSRRQLLASVSLATTASVSSIIGVPTTVSASEAASSSSSLSKYRSMIEGAILQLDPAVPGHIEKEQWDSVRNLLASPPLSDLLRQPALLNDYSSLVPEENGLDVLQAKEELVTHARFLDMAVYNNVFNPIKTMGENGATKQLIASYYEDPKREYLATINALRELYKLGE